MAEESPDDRIRRLVTAQFKRRLPRRFYTSVEVSDQNGILLDGKPVKTPMRQPLVLPTRVLALAVKDEWMQQERDIDLNAMRLTKLANTALDRATSERQQMLSEIVRYAGSDLVCYWSDHPPELVALQREHWQPVLDWANAVLNVQVRIAVGIHHVAQEEAVLAAVRERIERLDPWHLTTLYLSTTLTGSAFLAMMLHAEAARAEGVWTAAHVDEDFQISQWGEDVEAAERRKSRKLEFDAMVRFLALLKAT